MGTCWALHPGTGVKSCPLFSCTFLLFSLSLSFSDTVASRFRLGAGIKISSVVEIW